MGQSNLTQYPVLLGIALLPATYIGKFGFSTATAFQIYFSLLGIVATIAIDKLTGGLPIRKRSLIVITVIPWIFLICTILVQEDIIGVLFILTALIALQRNSQLLSVTILSLGIIFAKLFFFAFLAFSLLILCQRTKRYGMAFLAASPGVMIFIAGIVQSIIHNRPGFWTFDTPTTLSINAWSLFSENFNLLPLIKVTTLSYILLIGSFLYCTRYLRDPSLVSTQIAIGWLIIGVCITFFLYQIQPEYLFIIIPALVIPSLSLPNLLAIMVLFPISVIQNILFAISNSNQIYNSQGKRELLNQIIRHFPFLQSKVPSQLTAIIFTIVAFNALYGLLNYSKISNMKAQR